MIESGLSIGAMIAFRRAATLFAVGSRDGDTGDYTLRAVAVPDHGSTRVTATTLILDAPTSGKLTSTSDADYFKLVLTEAKDLAILAFCSMSMQSMLNSGGTEILVNIEIVAGGFNRIIDDFASGTYYVKITTTVYVSDGPLVSNTSQPPCHYGRHAELMHSLRPSPPVPTPPATPSAVSKSSPRMLRAMNLLSPCTPSTTMAIPLRSTPC